MDLQEVKRMIAIATAIGMQGTDFEYADPGELDALAHRIEYAMDNVIKHRENLENLYE